MGTCGTGAEVVWGRGQQVWGQREGLGITLPTSKDGLEDRGGDGLELLGQHGLLPSSLGS